MTSRAPAWFENKFKKGAIHLLQSKGYLLKGLTSNATGMNGNTVTWKLAGTGEASPMVFGEIGNRPVLNADRTTVTATMTPWEANDYIGAVEPHMMAENEQQVAQETIGMAIGRRFDRIIVSTLDAATLTQVGAGTTNLGLDNILDAQQQILSQGMGDMLTINCILPYKQLSALLLQKGFSSADYVDDSPLLKKVQARRWSGINFIPVPDAYLNVPTANQYDFYMFAQEAVGFATPTDEEGNLSAATRIDYVPEKKQYFAAATMMAACAVLQTQGVRRLRFASNVALSLAL